MSDLRPSDPAKSTEPASDAVKSHAGRVSSGNLGGSSASFFGAPETPTMLRERDEPRDVDDAADALTRVQALLAAMRDRHRLGEATDSLTLAERVPEDLRHLIDELHSADIAYVLEALPLEERLMVWDLVKTAERDGEILVEVSDGVRETLVESMDREELVAAAETLDVEELADIADDLPREVVEEVRQGLNVEEREQLRSAMSYAEDAVGALMDFDMVMIREDVTCEEVLRYLRQFDALPDQTDTVFVVDRDEQLKGALPISTLIVNDPEVMVIDLMVTDFVAFSASDEAREAAQAFERYDLVSAPVVDAHNKLVGRLTVNEVMDYVRESQEAAQLSQAGLREEEDIFAPIRKSVVNRAPWLLLNLITAGIASYVASRFEATVGQIVMLAFLMSIVAGIAGNSGNQTMTLIIRGIALGQVTAGNLRRLILKEIQTTLLIGFFGGAIAAVFAYLVSHRWDLGLVMWAAMLLNLLVGATIGIFVPIVRDRLGRDPAVGSSVLLTFATDTMGFFIFLGLATLFLR